MLCELIGISFFTSSKSGRNFCNLHLAYDDVRVSGRAVTTVLLGDDDNLHELQVGDLLNVTFDQRGRCVGIRKE